MAMTILSVTTFILIGALIGFLANRFLYENSSMLIDVILGIVGSLGFSWGATLFGLGKGFLAFSVWGVVLAILGAILLVWIYCFINERRNRNPSREARA